MASAFRQLSHLSYRMNFAGFPYLIFTMHVPGSEELEFGVTDGVDRFYRIKVNMEGLKKFLRVSTDIQAEKQLVYVRT